MRWKRKTCWKYLLKLHSTTGLKQLTIIYYQVILRLVSQTLCAIFSQTLTPLPWSLASYLQLKSHICNCIYVCCSGVSCMHACNTNTFRLVVMLWLCGKFARTMECRGSLCHVDTLLVLNVQQKSWILPHMFATHFADSSSLIPINSICSTMLVQFNLYVLFVYTLYAVPKLILHTIQLLICFFKM